MRLRMTALVLAQLLALSAGAALAQTPDPIADIAFWNSVKDSKSSAEIQAYLDKFPNGTFADLARIRLNGLKTAPAATAAPAPPAPAAAAPAPAAQATPAPVAPTFAATSADTIRQIQNKLYNLNYNLATRDGRMNTETRDAITRWRTNVKRTETGDMTEAEFKLLLSAEPVKTWGAIAYNAQGGASAQWNYMSREQVELAAMEGCRKLNGGACKMVTAANTGCGAIGFYSGTLGTTRYTGAYAVVRSTLAQATDGALTDCRAQGKVPNNCGIRTTMCADGSHKK